MPIKFTKFIVIICLLLSGGLQGQNAFRSNPTTDGWGFGNWQNDWGTPQLGGAKWDYTNSLGGPANRFFRFYTDYGGCLQEWGPSSNQEMTPGNSIALTQGNSAAYYAHVENTSWHYIFRTREVDACASAEAVYFEIQGAVQTISSVNQNPTAVYPGQDVVVDITLSGSSNIGQGYYLRYAIDDDWANSPIIELTGSGTSFSATIPGASNSANSNIKYYVFSSGSSLSIASTDADFFTFSLDNNTGLNYEYIVENEWTTANDGAWENPATWLANAVPGLNQPINIDAHSITTSTDVSVYSLNVRFNGSLTIGTNNTLTLTNFNSLMVTGSLSGSAGSRLVAPEGGYLSGSGTVAVYDLEIGEDNGLGNKNFFLNRDIEISNDLLIRDNGGLYPGGGQSVSLEMSSSNGDIIIDGLLDCVPNLGNTAGEHLAFHITGSQIILRPSDSVLGDLKFGDITIDSGASLVSDAAGALDIELQFGTLTCNGVLNLGQTATGVVNVTLRGTAGNNYYLNSGNPGQVVQFSDLLIGNNTANDGGNLILADGSESIEMRISGDFKNYFRFTALNSTYESIDVVMNGFLTNQEILGDVGETFNDKMTFENLTINTSSGDVFLNSSSIDGDADNNVAFEVSGTLSLLQGRIITLQSAPDPDIRHNLILLEDANIVASGAQSSELGQPCYIEGPIVRETGVGLGKTMSFPVGQGDDFRNLIFESDVATSSVQIKIEHFSYSANFAGMTALNPIINVSDARFWNVKASEPGNLTNIQFTLSYGDAITDGVTSEADLRVVWAEQDASTDGDLTNDEWVAIGTSGGASGSLISGVFSFPSGVSQIDLTLGNVGVGVNPLPVTWLSINCTPLLNFNQINWSTSSESNTSHFLLQRSNSDLDFKDINQIQAKGWSTEKTDYTLTDTNPLHGSNHYRIKQVDLDGNFSYSQIVSATKNDHTIAYPNPFKNEFTLESNTLKEDSSIELWSNTGILISKYTASKTPLVIPTHALAKGIYFLKGLSNYGQPTTIKLVKY